MENKDTSSCNFNIDSILDAFEQKDAKEKEEQKKRSEEKRNNYKNLIESKLRDTNRTKVEDKMFFSAEQKENHYYIENLKYINYYFVRAVATDFLFINIDFSKTIFDSCYLKNCRFIRCTFEGAKFMNSNLQGSYFENCNFDFVIFEKTFVDDEIFECAPKRNNLKYKFARSLKLNYASIGDYIKASNAVQIELEATKKHLYDTWTLNDDYHRNKYGGIRKRLTQFWKWFKVSLLDFIWGNGESLWRLVRFNLLIFLALTIYHIFKKSVTEFGEIVNLFFIQIPSNYFGIKVIKKEEINNVITLIDCFEYYPPLLSLILNISRLVCFGLLMSIIIKKYNRR
ncbi:pentapeptide repeat-containing protein [Myroides marinus]|uniref:pentapeptide repeat-containing protein n=1 Tax=Myroides marinus TaxID=703342 RepID=UPI00257771B6|nr:pentapeptide repeat-containing protein [Myroides marinus]MDM1377261.1 pentapeptide repeat-containing protein [Myroides marinus]